MLPALTVTLNLFSFVALCLFDLSACEPEPVLSLDKESIGFDQNGGSQTVAVTANNTWNVVVDNSGFYSVTPMSGTENGYITIQVDPNASASSRNAQVAVICSSRDMSVTKVVRISQTCPAGSVSSRMSQAFAR